MSVPGMSAEGIVALEGNQCNDSKITVGPSN